MTAVTSTIPKAFIWRRLHSLMGLWLVVFLIEHLLTNSQAALWLGDSGKGFIKMVNLLHNLPYLEVIEITLLGVPFLIHMVWGVKYLLTAKSNSSRSDGSTPYLPLARNRAYTWQRITSWILLIGIIGHVAKFRFIEYPVAVHVGDQTFYLIDISMDEGLYTVADRLNVAVYDADAVSRERKTLTEQQFSLQKDNQKFGWTGPAAQDYSLNKKENLTSAQRFEAKSNFVHALEKKSHRATSSLVRKSSAPPHFLP